MSGVSSDADRNWNVFLWFRVLFVCRFYYPVIAVLFLDLGLTAAQYTLMNVVWAVASLVSDVPAGVLADKIGRRPLLVAAGACMVAEMGLLAVAPRNGGSVLFLFCVANRLLSGLAEGLASGADEAIVYDSLAEVGRTSEWHRLLEQVTRWESVGFVITMLIGGASYAPGFMNGLLKSIGIPLVLNQATTLRFPIYLTLAAALGVLILALRFREPSRRLPHGMEDSAGRHASSLRDAWVFVRTAGRWLLNHPVPLFVVCAGFVLECAVRLFLTFSSSYFRLIGIPEIAFGALGAAMGGIGFFVSPWARRMVSTRSVAGSFVLIAAIVLTSLLGVALHLPGWGVIFAFLLGGAMTLIGYSVSTYLNVLVDSHHRATVLSLKGLTFNLAYGIASLLFAFALRISPGATQGEQLAHAFALVPPAVLCGILLVGVAFWRHSRKLRGMVNPALAQ